MEKLDSRGGKTGKTRKYYLYVCNYCPMYYPSNSVWICVCSQSPLCPVLLHTQRKFHVSPGSSLRVRRALLRVPRELHRRRRNPEAKEAAGCRRLRETTGAEEKGQAARPKEVCTYVHYVCP